MERLFHRFPINNHKISKDIENKELFQSETIFDEKKHNNQPIIISPKMIDRGFDLMVTCYECGKTFKIYKLYYNTQYQLCSTCSRQREEIKLQQRVHFGNVQLPERVRMPFIQEFSLVCSNCLRGYSMIGVHPPKKPMCWDCGDINNDLEGKSKKLLLDDKPKDTTCVVCFDRDITILVSKCGHFCFCDVCGFALDKCPICRISYKPEKHLVKPILVR